ncbi:hypothetical protein [Rubinisphaera sp.]|uniref:hypothetical protein n=1 Tax=Rubinisphaera sp. TaxID=2024857 RepID=UPI000C0E9E71|nr:hypothetical protein [Rubinisphaera sp.]MBV10067.1 hypothetical protein [Rubinisphaera sp.]HCS53784.1 hypothetical protein [Planctomycetaceae bacterium]|tara:strand:- start:5117 stop:5485 length:369 start_codon:yes stop_codon:yes gene_type:complete
MSTFVVNEKSYSEIESGFYTARFIEFSGPHKSETEGSSDYYKFLFEDNDRQYVGFGDVSKMGPRTQNKLGRFLLGLAGKPQSTTERTEIETEDYVGKEYVLIYGPNNNGKTKLLSFSPAAAQ